MNEILEEINWLGLVPVIAIDRLEQSVPLGKALLDGGLPCAEVTFRTPAAADVWAQISHHVRMGSLLCRRAHDHPA
ncbi:hypothetical protein ACFLUA_05310 [Chloroflexota bacterium]